jgi:hypothetical protein
MERAPSSLRGKFGPTVTSSCHRSGRSNARPLIDGLGVDASACEAGTFADFRQRRWMASAVHYKRTAWTAAPVAEGALSCLMHARVIAWETQAQRWPVDEGEVFNRLRNIADSLNRRNRCWPNRSNRDSHRSFSQHNRAAINEGWAPKAYSRCPPEDESTELRRLRDQGDFCDE